MINVLEEVLVTHAAISIANGPYQTARRWAIKSKSYTLKNIAESLPESLIGEDTYQAEKAYNELRNAINGSGIAGSKRIASMLPRSITGHAINKSESGPGDSEGRWVTINGNHLFIKNK